MTVQAEVQYSVCTPSSREQEMLFIPGGTFRMGSDKHYPEEAPVHASAERQQMTQFDNDWPAADRRG